MNLEERLDNLRKEIETPKFLEGKGRSNEDNINIFCYDPKEEMTVRHFTENLVNNANLSCRIIEYNLYDVFLSICEDRRISDKVAGLEEKNGKKFVMDKLSGMAKNRFISKMKSEPHKKGDVVLITGVGSVFPFVRVHALLEAMQSHFSDVPILVMYPGKFDGRYLKLFDKLNANPYYRAFNDV